MNKEEKKKRNWVSKSVSQKVGQSRDKDLRRVFFPNIDCY